ncbi:MAG TPA: metal ABC transporter ATP-binding protein [Tepidisphaeraceae bacterium]|nr:metal ABC transporter ATP-binding protein [Tepidisphaeraceae bacterium]
MHLEDQMPAVATIDNLDFAFGESLVLKHVSLAIEQGTTVGLIGPNGGGKTTLIRLLLGLLEPTRGQLRIAGLTPREAVRRGDLVGYLPQSQRVPSRLPLSVRQVVRMGLAGKTGMLRVHPKDDLAFADELLGVVGISELADVPVATLSGGQFQRVLIARALAPRPKLLLLDEPTTGIDRSGQQRFIESIQELKTRLGLTIVFVSHDLRAVSAVSDRIACLNLTLHYHDVPEHLPADLVYRMFACDLEAFGLPNPHTCAGNLCETHAPTQSV